MVQASKILAFGASFGQNWREKKYISIQFGTSSLSTCLLTLVHIKEQVHTVIHILKPMQMLELHVHHLKCWTFVKWHTVLMTIAFVKKVAVFRDYVCIIPWLSMHGTLPVGSCYVHYWNTKIDHVWRMKLFSWIQGCIGYWVPLEMVDNLYFFNSTRIFS